MSSGEFDQQAAVIAEQIPELPEADRFPAASRGSANPAALAWLAEGLRFDAGTRVVDLGAGLGGPAGWLAARYGCTVVALEPAPGAAAGAADLFELPVIRGAADAAPLRDGAFDVALLLGVTSVVADPGVVLAEAARLAPGLGLLDYCATGDEAVEAGGSRFLTPAELLAAAEAAGWEVEQSAPLNLASPRSWSTAADAVDAPAHADEAEVVAAIDGGRIAPFLAMARR